MVQPTVKLYNLTKATKNWQLATSFTNNKNK